MSNSIRLSLLLLCASAQNVFCSEIALTYEMNIFTVLPNTNPNETKKDSLSSHLDQLTLPTITASSQISPFSDLSFPLQKIDANVSRDGNEFKSYLDGQTFAFTTASAYERTNLGIIYAAGNTDTLTITSQGLPLGTPVQLTSQVYLHYFGPETSAYYDLNGVSTANTANPSAFHTGQFTTAGMSASIEGPGVTITNQDVTATGAKDDGEGTVGVKRVVTFNTTVGAQLQLTYENTGSLYLYYDYVGVEPGLPPGSTGIIGYGAAGRFDGLNTSGLVITADQADVILQSANGIDYSRAPSYLNSLPLATATPEPAEFLLSGLGLCCFMLVKRVMTVYLL